MLGFSRNLVAATVALAALGGIQGIAGEVPEKKRTDAGLYLTAVEAAELKESRDDIVLIDIRSRAEVAFVGIAANVDKHIPYMMIDDFWEFDEEKGTYKLVINPDFQRDMEEYLSRRGLDKDTLIILMCRSGNRSANAANLLNALGYHRVYSVIDGFEGDKGPDGARSVNGWKNAGLPWGYKVSRQVAY